MVLLIILISAVLVFNIWNLITLSKLRKQQANQQVLSDPKYYELKARQDFLVAVFSVFVATSAFLGYNSLKGIEENVKEDFDGKLKGQQDKMEVLAGFLNATDSTVRSYPDKFQNYETLLLSLEKRQSQVSQTNSLSAQKANEILERIKEINSKNIIQQNIYIVDNISFTRAEIDKMDGNSGRRILYSDLTTISGDKLPSFKKEPFILVISNDGADYYVKKVTPTSFELMPFSIPGDAKIIEATLFITENP